MKMKKLAIASAIAMMGMSAAYAAEGGAVSTPTESTTTQETGLVTALTTALGDLFSTNRVATITGSGVDAVKTYSSPVDITAIAGAVNMSTINGSIDISGTNVTISGINGAVSAKAEALGGTANSTAFAINGNNFSTTVIGAMNSSTLDIQSKTTNLAASVNSALGVGSLAADATASMTNPGIGAGGGTLTGAVAAGKILDSTGSIDLTALTSSLALTGSSLTDELQTMNVFNMALNVAPIVAGVKIAALPDASAWFLNPQTGVVSLSNLQLATTAIGAMNSSVTHLGKNLTTLAK